MRRAAGVALLAAALAGCPSGIPWEEPHAYPCDGGGDLEQCPGGWSCGIDGVCHSGDAGAYPCTEDSHCVQPWRCSAADVCADPTGDQLAGDVATVFEDPTPVSPKLLTARPERFAVSPPSTPPGGGFLGETYTWIAGGELTLMVRTGDSGDGGVSDVASVAIPLADAGGPPLELAAARRRAILMHGDRLTVFGPLEAPAVIDVPLPLAPEALHVTHDVDPQTLIVAHTAQEAAVYRLGAPAAVPLPLPRRRDGGALELLDLASLPDTDAEKLLATTADGLFVGFRDGGSTDVDWAPLELGPYRHAECSGLEGPLPVRLHPGIRSLHVEAIDAGEPVERLAAWRVGFLTGASVERPGHCAALTAPQSFSPLRPAAFQTCGEYFGEPVLGVYLAADADGGAVHELRCGPDDSNFALWPVAEDFGGAAFDLPYQFSAAVPRVDEPLAVSRNVSFASGFVREDGQIWASRADSDVEAVPLMLDSIPALVLGSGDGVAALTARGARRAVAFRMDPVLGFARKEDLAIGLPLARVDGRDEWLVVERSAEPQQLAVVDWTAGDGAEPVALLPAGARFFPPYHATLAPRADGRTELVVSAADALLSVDVTDRDLTRAALLEVRAVPLPRSSIHSLLAVAPGDGELAAGYALSTGNVYRFWARTANRWEVAPVDLAAGEWFELWADLGRARVGYRDGRIFALPSRVQLSEALPLGDRMVDLDQLCGTPVALTEALTGDGIAAFLYHLQARPGSSLWRWNPLPLSLPTHSSGHELENMKLHGAGDRLYVFSQFGRVLEVRANCPR